MLSLSCHIEQNLCLIPKHSFFKKKKKMMGLSGPTFVHCRVGKSFSQGKKTSLSFPLALLFWKKHASLFSQQCRIPTLWVLVGGFHCDPSEIEPHWTLMAMMLDVWGNRLMGTLMIPFSFLLWLSSFLSQITKKGEREQGQGQRRP